MYKDKAQIPYCVIHNYNMIPEQLVSYLDPDHFIIFDASDDGKTMTELESKGWPVRHLRNTGHNITSYFEWISEHYDDMPDVVMFAKGNMIGRHCSAEYFERVCHNTWFTYLYEEHDRRERYAKTDPARIAANHGKDPNADSIAALASESQYLELNSDCMWEQEIIPADILILMMIFSASSTWIPLCPGTHCLHPAPVISCGLSRSGSTALPFTGT